MINVTVVHHSLASGGGSERVIYDLVRRLDRSRFRCSLVCLYGLGDWGERLRDLGHPTHSELMAGPHDLRGIRRVAQALREEQTDILYVTDGFINMIIGRIGASLAHVPETVLAFHSFDTILRRRATRLARFRLRLADDLFHPRFTRYIALAESHRAYLEQAKRLPHARIAAIPNGVDVAEYEPTLDRLSARDSLGLPQGALIASVLASLRKWKAHDVLFRAVEDALHQLPALYLVLAGDGPERQRLEGLARQLGIADRVRFLGKVADVALVLAASDVSVLASESEAFPLSLLESMCASLPVIATDTGCVADIVDDGVTGRLVAVGSIEQMSAALIDVLGDLDRARTLGSAGRQRVESRFDISKTVEAYGSAFEDWMASHSC